MRQFIVSVMPDIKGKIVLNDKERRYLINVLRLKTGDKIDVRLPNGILHSMNLQVSRGDTKKSSMVELYSNEPLQDVSVSDTCIDNQGVDYWLFQLLPKNPKMDLIVRQATECGAKAIVPILGEYSVAITKKETNSDHISKVGRWERIIREAKQQCGSSVDTKIFMPCSLFDAITLWQENIEKTKKDSLGFVLRERQEGQENLFSIIREKQDFSNISIGFVVGCEGGISPSELALLEKNSFYPIHLQTNILRAETAALYSFAVLQTVVGEYNEWKELKE